MDISPSGLCDHSPTHHDEREDATMRRTGTLAVVSVAALAVAGLAGCGSDTPTQADAESQACDAIASLSEALQGVGEIDADSTVEQAQQAQESLDEAIAGLQDAATDLEAADSAALQAGGQAISTAIDGVSGSDTLGAAGAVVAQAADSLSSAVAEIKDGLGCS
jgi:hypothetical protein